MKNATAHAKKLRGLLRRVKPVEPQAPALNTLIDQVIYAALSYEATRKQATAAYESLMRMAVDYNDLRVTDPHEMVREIGADYPSAVERVLRLREILHAVYLREHSMDLLAALQKASKRDARAYLDALPGMNAYISASVVLMGLNGHAIPLDELLLGKLRREGVIDEQATLHEAQAFLEHQISAKDAIKTHHILRTFAEAGGVSRKPAAAKSEKKAVKKTKVVKTVKKAVSKKTASKKKVTKKKTTRR